MKRISPLELKKLSSSELLTSTKSVVNDERMSTSAVIDHLREVESRMLFLELGFESLHQFAIKELGLSEGSAHRRISAMRLIRDIPEAKEKIESGKISLSNAAKVQTSFNSMRKKRSVSTSEKETILQSCENSTQAECEKILFEAIPELVVVAKTQEKIRPLSSDLTEIKIVVSNELNSKIETLLNLTSHQNPNLSLTRLLEKLVNEELKRQEKNKPTHESQEVNLGSTAETFANHSSLLKNKTISQNLAAGRTETTCSGIKNKNSKTIQGKGFVILEKSKKITAETRRQVWIRAKGKCEFKNCGSHYQLEVDHIIPKALGGSNELSNLRFLCRKHNVFAATKEFGKKHMEKFVHFRGESIVNSAFKGKN